MVNSNYASGCIVFVFLGLLIAIKRTLSTPLVLTAIISYIAMANLLSGVATFGSSYVQMIFNIFRTTSDMLIGKLFRLF